MFEIDEILALLPQLVSSNKQIAYTQLQANEQPCLAATQPNTTQQCPGAIALGRRASDSRELEAACAAKITRAGLESRSG